MGRGSPSQQSDGSRSGGGAVHVTGSFLAAAPGGGPAGQRGLLGIGYASDDEAATPAATQQPSPGEQAAKAAHQAASAAASSGLPFARRLAHAVGGESKMAESGSPAADIEWLGERVEVSLKPKFTKGQRLDLWVVV